MKLLRAQFHNFRLLRDVQIDFSVSRERKLTVIRAANETAKTTLLHALQWTLYGDNSLPEKGLDFRLHPIDWDIDGDQRVPVTATVEFEVTTMRRVAGVLRESSRQYRLVRSAVEQVNGTAWQRTQSTARLFALSDVGASPVEPADAVINDELPPELRDVFFTDGDRALRFIEADAALSTKRERVQRAIRSLLGLSVLEEAIKHVKRAGTEVNKQARRIGAGGELDSIATRLDKIEGEVAKLESEIEDAKQQFSAFDERVSDADRKILAALQKGDKEKLSKELDHARRTIKQLDDQLLTAGKQHSQLFRRQVLATGLLAPILGKSFAMLQKLKDEKRIPSTTIPVLREQLQAERCICGENLDPEDAAGMRRRQHIEAVIAESAKSDELKEIITDLYYDAKGLQGPDEGGTSWLEEYEKVVKARDGLQILRDDAGKTLRALELQLADLPNTDIQGLREAKRQFLEQRDRFLAKRSERETQLAGLTSEREELSAERNRLLREQDKSARILSELQVTEDILRVLDQSYNRITGDELTKVSALMNRIFLEMIGADPEQGAIIRRAEINRDFDITVYGPNDRTLNPDRDLNGASRRALTIAFILALTKVSEVEAPNVIDTPLGMTSGYVKRSILRTAIRESAQLILFLTQDEIQGCEKIIDEAAGAVFTLTNPAHYPVMLINDSGIRGRILRCECNHRMHCRICERRPDPRA